MVCLPVRGTSPTSCAIKNVGIDPRISPIDIRLVRGTRLGFRTPHLVELKYTDRRGFLTSWINAHKSIRDKNVPPILVRM
ncbi:MAG TPA: hypothetical protein VFF49_11865 [Thermodesulfobacteriota bacterium]|nr:hypothetical protein [Thermodesulfobacteriota bacterium]